MQLYSPSPQISVMMLLCRAIVEDVCDTLCALSEMAQKLIALHYNIL